MNSLNCIKEREKVVLIQSIINTSKNPTANSIYNQLKLIDDLLTLQKNRSLFMPKRTKSGTLRKDVSLKRVIEKRIESELKQQ